MKKRIAIAFFLLAAVLSLPAFAQAQSHSVVLAWTASVVATGQPAINSYQVLRGTTSGGETFLANAGTTAGTANLTYTDTTVVNGTTYFYEVVALNSVGPSPPSNEISAAIPATVLVVPVAPILSPPTIMTAAPVAAAKVK
jgi:Fibronectin type III domain